MCTCSAAAAFAWAGFIIINGAMIGLITLLSGSSMIMGAIQTFIYAVLLLVVALCLERSMGSAESDDGAPRGVVTVLYLLCVVALGTSGGLFAFADFDRYDCGRNQIDWKPSADVPQDILDLDNSYSIYASYAYFPISNITWFASSKSEDGSGAFGTFSNDLYLMAVSSAGGPPTVVTLPASPFELTYPSQFVSLPDGTACVIDSDRNIYCSKTGHGSDIRKVDGPSATNLYVSSSDSAKALWYTGYIEDDGYAKVYYSVNLTTMETELRSERVEDSDEECDDNRASRTRGEALRVLLGVCAPVFVASLALYLTKRVPSMTLSGYLAVTATVVASYVYVEPDDPQIQDLLDWWLTLTGGILLDVLASLSLTKRISPSVTAWGSVTLGLAYAVGMFGLLEIFSAWEDWDEWWRWVLINILCFIPLIVGGLLLDQIFLITLGAIGLIMDAIYLANKFPDDWTIARYMFLALFGGLIIAMGLFLQRKSKGIREATEKWAAETFNVSRNNSDGEATSLLDLSESETKNKQGTVAEKNYDSA